MGYKHTPWVLAKAGLNHNEKLVLWCLTMHANNDTRRTWVSVPTIARECGYSEGSRNTVRKALRGLREKGCISYEEQRAGQGEKQSSNTYTVHWSSTPGAVSTVPPVLVAPPPGADSTTNEELNEEVLNEEPPYTPDPGGSDPREELAPSTEVEAEIDRDDLAAQADPVSPEFYRSPERARLIEIIQSCASVEDQEKRDHYFYTAIEDLFQEDLSAMQDLGWSVRKRCTTKFEAVVWMNTFINSARYEADAAMTWRPPHA